MNYLNNYKSAKLSSLSNKDIMELCRSLLESVFIYTNRTPNDKTGTITNFISDIKELNISVEELKESLRQGMRGNYGEVKDISNLVLYKWVNNYLTNPERIDIIKKYESQFSIAKELTPEEVRIKDIKCLKELFIDYKMGNINYISCFRGGWYDLLKELNAPDLADYKRFTDIAKNKLIVEESETKVRSAKDIIAVKQIIQAIGSNDKSVEKRIEFKAKELAVNEYFELIETLELSE